MTVTGTNGTSAINAVAGTDATSASTTTPSTQKTLGQDAFLKLLITQLENQDPTQPKDDTEFIAQLATFSQLEKLSDIDVSVKQMSEQLAAYIASGGAAGSTNKT